MKPQVFDRIPDWQELRGSAAFGGKTLGFVPTMGALHDGHVSLVETSRRENDFTLVSIFVNPTQFNDPNDLKKYPRTPEADLERLARAGADYVLYPRFEELYADSYRYRLSENEFSRKLCGAHRPGHFDGVLTVVMKLLNLARANHAYFGEKDFQQYLLIRGMAEAFFHPTRIVACPTIREKDGLAMSSRNLLLSPEERRQAGEFARLLKRGGSITEVRTALEDGGFIIDYVEEHSGRRFAAVRVGEVRLIDNVQL